MENFPMEQKQQSSRVARRRSTWRRSLRRWSEGNEGARVVGGPREKVVEVQEAVLVGGPTKIKPEPTKVRRLQLPPDRSTLTFFLLGRVFRLIFARLSVTSLDVENSTDQAFHKTITISKRDRPFARIVTSLEITTTTTTTTTIALPPSLFYCYGSILKKKSMR